MNEHDETDGRNIIDSALEAGSAGAKLQEIKNDGDNTHYLIPRERKVVELGNNKPNPSRKKGKRYFSEAKGFCNYVLKHKNQDETVIVANEGDVIVKAVFNDHGKKTAGWGDFAAVLDIKYSSQFKEWYQNTHSRGEDYFDQASFAEFLERNRTDMMVGKIEGLDGKEIENMSALELSAMITNLETTFEETFTSKVDNVSGRKTLHFENDDVGKGTIAIPKQFILAIPIYKGGDIFQVTIRLFHRIGGGSARFFFMIDQEELLKEKAFDMICDRVENGNIGTEKDERKQFAGTGIEVYKGKL